MEGEKREKGRKYTGEEEGKSETHGQDQKKTVNDRQVGGTGEDRRPSP